MEEAAAEDQENDGYFYQVPSDDSGSLYFDAGVYAEDLRDASHHMPEYKYTVTGGWVRLDVTDRSGGVFVDDRVPLRVAFLHSGVCQ